MDSKLALDKIKEAELKAEEIIAEAKKESQRILQSALIEKTQIIKQAQERVKVAAQKLKKETEEVMLQEISEIKKQSQLDIEEIKLKADGKVAQVVEYLREKIG